MGPLRLAAHPGKEHRKNTGQRHGLPAAAIPSSAVAAEGVDTEWLAADRGSGRKPGRNLCRRDSLWPAGDAFVHRSQAIVIAEDDWPCPLQSTHTEQQLTGTRDTIHCGAVILRRLEHSRVPHSVSGRHFHQ